MAAADTKQILRNKDTHGGEGCRKMEDNMMRIETQVWEDSTCAAKMRYNEDAIKWHKWIRRLMITSQEKHGGRDAGQHVQWQYIYSNTETVAVEMQDGS